jgi:type I restriction enzyme, S subunit
MRAIPNSPLGQVLNRVQEPAEINPEETYKQVTVRLFHKGVVLRGLQHGGSIRSRQWRVRAGQVLLSRIDARNGAIGLIPTELNGAIVTNDFWPFDVDTGLAESRYLDLYFGTRQFVEDCQRASEGTTNRVRVQPDRFLRIEVPLPPLADQRRIIARIEELSAKIEEGRRIRRQAAEHLGSILASYKNVIFTKLTSGTTISLGQISEIQAGVTLGRTLRGNTTRLPYLRVANVQDGRLDLSHIKEINIYPDEQDKWLLRSGDLLLTEGGDWDKLGRGTVWLGEIPRCIHQNHIFRVRLDPLAFNPWYVSLLMGSPFGKTYFQAASKQTTNLASINQKQLRAFPVPKIPIAEQTRIVAYLDDLQAKVDTVKKLQDESESELNALMPSILSRAFAGELL